jgi:hypothetical protein
MTKIIDGRKAEITNSLQVYTNWVTLATEHGYPKAAYVYGSDKRSHLNDGDTVTVLTSTFVHDGAMIWVVQARNGDQFLYSEKGLRILPGEPAAITLLPDESLGGVLREYREVKRKANVGELVKITDNSCGHRFPIGEIVRVRSSNTAEYLDKRDWWAVKEVDYVVLEASDILRIDGERFRMVDRKAAVGERVIVTKTAPRYGSFSVGEHGIVTGERGWVDADVNVDFGDKTKFIGPSAVNSEYAVLEPLTSAELAPTPTPLSELPLADQYAENITVLTRKIAQLEEGAKTLEERILALETDSSPSYVKVASGPVDNRHPLFSKAPAQVADAYADLAAKMFAAPPVKSAQQIRDEIVERAKADVGDLRKFSGKKIPNDFVSFWPKTELPHAYIAMHTVEFVVNSAKRTVAVVIRCTEDGLTTRGIAKCAPGETFNAHIGRAIALYRALGLEVPAEYLTCPQPETVRVGDVVLWTNSYDAEDTQVFTIASVLSEGYRFVGGEWDGFETVRVIDDSREDGGNSAASSALKGAA